MKIKKLFAIVACITLTVSLTSTPAGKNITPNNPFNHNNNICGGNIPSGDVIIKN